MISNMYMNLSPTENGFLWRAYIQAKKSLEKGGLPIGAVLSDNDNFVPRDITVVSKQEIQLLMVRWCVLEMQGVVNITKRLPFSLLSVRA